MVIGQDPQSRRATATEAVVLVSPSRQKIAKGVTTPKQDTTEGRMPIMTRDFGNGATFCRWIGNKL